MGSKYNVLIAVIFLIQAQGTKIRLPVRRKNAKGPKKPPGKGVRYEPILSTEPTGEAARNNGPRPIQATGENTAGKTLKRLNGIGSFKQSETERLGLHLRMQRWRPL